MLIVRIIVLAIIQGISQCCMQSVPKNLIERRAIALGAHNVDFDMRDRKCSQADLQPYTAKELRQLASIYEFHRNAERNMLQGGRLTCNFNVDDEICSWYGSNPPNTTTIEKARFETILDLDRFDCTNERRFPFDGYFLLAGGQNLTDPSNAPAIEALIPCLHQPATISFDYWANSGRPFLMWCIIYAIAGDFSCERIAKMRTNPVSFTIASSDKPFRLQIRVSNLQAEDIVLIDNIVFKGHICANVNKTYRLFDSNKDAKIDDYFIEQSLLNNESNERNICDALICRFQYNDICLYSVTGIRDTSGWETGQRNTDKSLSGIHVTSFNDDETHGIVFVKNDLLATSDEYFIMESENFKVNQPLILMFDLFLRSVGPSLRVCINDLDNCPYRSATPNSSTPWMIDQLVNLPQDATKVLFIADGISTNRSLAIDNIRLRSMEGEDFCRQYLQRKSTANNDFPQ